ncbi:hypothetical protein INT46_006178 [Mucor plumbeus]|uniref:Kinetochore protein Spc24 n=1 Tax=Mucor plumbeus TaxID=97098 RepID=A0A8H7QD65_9FUNG|nr:hypothetical protein INT46_006178 [Mucor plumbeus]
MYIKFITDIDPYILELKNESGNLELEESTITKTYNAVNEEYAQNETELKRQEALQAIEIAEIDQLKEEIRLMELELNELEGPETSLAAVPPNELRLMLYRGLGVSTGDLNESTMIENNMAETIVLTTSDGHDILTMGLNQYGIDYLSNQVWEFISK